MMQKQKLLAGIRSVTFDGAGIVSVLLLSQTVKSFIFGAITGLVVTVCTGVAVYFFNHWFEKAELAVLCAALAGFGTTISFLVCGQSFVTDLCVAVMVITIVYIMSVGTKNFTDRVDLEWVVGAGVGFGAIVLTVGLVRMALPQETGFTFIAAALGTAIARKILTRYV